MAEVEDVCRRCDVLKDIETLPEGFDTRIRDTETGRLAQGVMQKITIARALLPVSQSPLVG